VTRFLVEYLRLRRTRVWVLLLSGLALALAFTPLFNLLSYEFCMALAVGASLASTHMGSALVATLRQRDDGMLLTLGQPVSTLFALVGRCIAANLLLLVLPLAIITLNALRVKNCDYVEGLAFFGMMPVLSVVVATSVGALWSLLVPRPALATLGAMLTLVGSLLWGLYRFYDAPPIFGYDPFVGHFPGTLYDEDVAIRLTFLLYRLYNLLWLSALLLGAAHLFDPTTLRLHVARWRPSRRLTGATLVVLSAAVVMFLLRGTVGFAIDGDRIAQVLGGARHTTHFTIYHPREMSAEQVDLLAQDHEFRHAQLTRLMGVEPAHITSFIFRSSDEKRTLMGAGHTFIAKPWRREVYLQQAAFPHPVLKHELAHVFAGQFGDRLFGVSLRWRETPVPHPVFNVGLIEGLAVAADWRPYLEQLDGHQMAAALVRLKLAPPPATLFGYGFLTQAASRSYVLAGSVCRYLADRHGFHRLAAVYRDGGDFVSAYGRPLADLLDQWSRFIATVQVPDDALQLARERFRRPSILRRVCGHEVANLVAQSDEAMQDRQTGQAVKLMHQVCAFDPGEPSHLLQLMQLRAAAGDATGALATGARLLRHPALSKPLRREALELTGDVRWIDGEPALAARSYDDADGQAALPFDRRVLFLKRWALKQPPEIRDLVRRYLIPPFGEPRETGLDVHLAHRLARALPRSGLGMFLAGKQLAARNHHEEAALALQQALRIGLPTEDFTVDASRLLGLCQYASRQYVAAVDTFVRLQARPNLSRGMELEVADWIQRIHWRTGGSAPRGVSSNSNDSTRNSQR